MTIHSKENLLAGWEEHPALATTLKTREGGGLADPFDDGRFTLPDANAQGRQAKIGAFPGSCTAFHFVQEGGEDACPGTA
jgi:hypothetical protein